MRTIDGHTFNDDLLSDGCVIDAGCRGFLFADYFFGYGPSKLVCIDIEKFSVYPKGVNFKHAALSHYSGQTEAYYFEDGTANFLAPLNQAPGNTPDRPCETKVVQCITLDEIYKEIGTDIDLLKLDIEGAEYQILENLKPIPRQISVEFHEHTVPHLHNSYIKQVLEHLCKHYHLTLYQVEPRYHFLDCLFVRKDIL